VVGSHRKYPRHRNLISINKLRTGHEEDLPVRTAEYDMRHDWNSLLNGESVGGRSVLMANFSQDYLPKAGDLVKYIEAFVDEYDLNVDYGQTVTHIGRESDGRLRLSGTGKEYLCKTVVVATGLATPDVPAFRGRENIVSYDDMSTDQNDYKDKSVLIIGKGNAGMETASHLLDVANYVHITSRSPVRMSIATHYVGDLRLTGRAGSVIEGYQLKSMNGFYDTNWDALMDKVEFQKSDEDGRIRIVPVEGGLANKTAVRKYVYPLNRAYDTVIACTGWKFDKTIFGDEVMPEMTPMKPRRDFTGEFAGAAACCCVLP
jgi:thioredoxin reductase